MKTLIYYHDRCHDGLTAAWVLLHALPDAVAKGVSFGHPPPLEEAQGFDRVIFADVCLEGAYLNEHLLEGRDLILLDHHATSKTLVKGYDFETSIDTHKSGAGLALQWALTTLPGEFPHGISLVVEYAQDRDLWRFDLPKSKEVYEYVVATIPLDIERALPALDDLATLLLNDFETVAQIGGLLLLRKEQRIEEAARRAIVRGGVTFVNADPDIKSDVGSHLGPGLVVAWNVDEKGIVRCSARGQGARAWAEARGGGGHDLAAGCAVTMQQMMEMLT